MNKKLKHLLKHLILGTIFGFTYLGIELLYRQRTHWTMFIVAFLAGNIVGALNSCFDWDMSVVGQALIGSLVITGFEFMSGCIINLGLGWNVWDYSNLCYNLMGQISLVFTNLWFLLCIPLILFDDWLRFKLFGEPVQKYKWL